MPREGFKKAYSWAEGVVTARQMEKVGFVGSTVKEADKAESDNSILRLYGQNLAWH